LLPDAPHEVENCLAALESAIAADAPLDDTYLRLRKLVELIRDTDFHDSGGNIIWRVELWYYKNQFGGWQKVQQQSKVLARERFKDQKAFNAKVAKIKWIPELGGLKIPKGKDRAEVTLKPIE